MNYHYLLKHRELFPYVIGVKYSQFEAILPKFSRALRVAKVNKAWSKPRVRQPGGGRKAALKTDRQKLFFMFFYYKVYPTFRLAQVLFEFDKRNIQLWFEFLQSVFNEVLGYELKLPLIKARCVNDVLIVCPLLKEFLIDASERRVQRPKDPDNQEFYYSGKKKYHTVKNQILVNPRTKKIIAVSATVEGKRHDKKLAEDDPVLIHAPPRSKALADLGYQGLETDLNSFTKFVTPYKKPPGGELSDFQKQNNKQISSIRVKVEHPFSYLKHFNILSHTFRSRIPKAHQPFVNSACVYNFTRIHR